MKDKLITLQDIESIDQKTIAKILYETIQFDDRLYKKVQSRLMKNDAASLQKQLTKRINSISRGRKFVEYRYSFELAKDIELIVEDIKELVEDKKVALKLLKKLILTDENVFARCDDSSGSVQYSYSYAQDLYKKYAPKYLDEKTLLTDIKELLIHEGYGMRDILDESTPQDVLTALYDTILEKYIAHQEEFGGYTYENILQSIARLLKKPELYIEAFKKKGMKLHDYKLLDIALEYKAVQDEVNTSEYLGMIQEIPTNSVSEYFEALLWCDEKRGDHLALSNHLRDYYEKTRSTTILKRYLDRLDGEFYKQEKMRILNNAESFSFDEAIDQFIALDARQMCAEFIYNKLPSISYINHYTIKNVEQFLGDEYAQIIIQLYKVQIDDLLKVANTKYYPTVIKILKKMKKLADTSTQEYIQKIIEKHHKKKTLMRLLHEAFSVKSNF